MATTNKLDDHIYLGCWYDIVTCLFGDDPICKDYYQACINKNLKKAKNEINKGAFAETTYQWEDQFSCNCNCDGCEIRSVHRTFEYYSMLREITLSSLKEFGLYNPEV